MKQSLVILLLATLICLGVAQEIPGGYFQQHYDLTQNDETTTEVMNIIKFVMSKLNLNQQYTFDPASGLNSAATQVVAGLNYAMNITLESNSKKFPNITLQFVVFKALDQELYLTSHTMMTEEQMLLKNYRLSFQSDIVVGGFTQQTVDLTDSNSFMAEQVLNVIQFTMKQLGLTEDYEFQNINLISVATQVVAGMNYKVSFKVTPKPSVNAKPLIVNCLVYVDLSRQLSLTSSSTSQTARKLVGGWTQQDVATLLKEKSQNNDNMLNTIQRIADLVMSTHGLTDNYTYDMQTGLKSVATQVVAGINWQVSFVFTPKTSNNSSLSVDVTVYQDLSQQLQITQYQSQSD